MESEHAHPQLGAVSRTGKAEITALSEKQNAPLGEPGGAS